MGAGRWQGGWHGTAKKWALPPALPEQALASEARHSPQFLGCKCACLAWVSHTAVVLLSILSLGKNVRHSSYSKQHPWCLVSWVRFTPQWSLAVNFHTSAVCVGSSPCFANWTESGKGSLPSTHGKGRHLSSFCQPAGRPAEARGRARGQVSSICLFLPPWAVRKMLRQRFHSQPFGKTLKQSIWGESVWLSQQRIMGSGEEEKQGWYLPCWACLLWGSTFHSIHNMESACVGGGVFSTCTHSGGSEAFALANLFISSDLKAHQNWWTLPCIEGKKNRQGKIEL